MYEKTTIAFAFAAGALLSGVITGTSSMVMEHILFAKGGRIEAPATREAASRSDTVRSDTVAPIVPGQGESTRVRGSGCPGDRTGVRIDEFTAPRRVLVQGFAAAPGDTPAGPAHRPCGRRAARTAAEV